MHIQGCYSPPCASASGPRHTVTRYMYVCLHTHLFIYSISAYICTYIYIYTLCIYIYIPHPHPTGLSAGNVYRVLRSSQDFGASFGAQRPGGEGQPFFQHPWARVPRLSVLGWVFLKDDMSGVRPRMIVGTHHAEYAFRREHTYCSCHRATLHSLGPQSSLKPRSMLYALPTEPRPNRKHI